MVAQSKLMYVDDDMPGITRKRSGRGWAYYDPKGELITDPDERDRLNRVALPPAYTDAWFCPAPNGHILATGVDAKGRKQYRYHPDFRTARESEKFDGCAAFGRLLPLVRKRVKGDLAVRSLTRERAIASVIRLLDLGAIRIGNDAYARSNKSFGATTLRQHHVEVKGQRIRLKFKGKSGVERDVVLSDRTLSRVVRAMQDLPGQRLFQYTDEDGDVHSVDSADVNEYLCETMGDHFTAKSFRTWHASVLALKILAEADGQLTLKAMLEDVAAHLGNTPAVTRKSYVHPAVIALVDRQKTWRDGLKMPRATRWLDRAERALIDLLEDSPKAHELLAAA
ncbi:DNA topoisomerase IB [Tsuneonella sp. YG55]|uniref:DNA topoisomerase n=1 Tax=Tsuneonella litorea TaxID=2976475 RepID=A0A9X2W020_9SPHN|nr:DNA topoisomerase IB [Tsuneonella litorea]MCT2558413.1 DNA topoisomerase IB [Tsuneonella litorea]